MTSRSLAVEYLSVASLGLNPKNPRLHSDKQIRQLANSIKTFGFNVPVLVDAHLQVIAGHGRVRACKLLEITEVPTIRLEHLSEQQKRAFLIADNRLAENADWDYQLLGEQLRILSEAELDFTLETTGFEMGEIDLIIEDLLPATSGQDDPADFLPALPSTPVEPAG
jgi:ParB-like chromosome segregation protein Spo0J